VIEEHKKRDIKKLWNFFIFAKYFLRCRSWDSSRDIKVEEDKENKLIDPIVDYLLIPYSMRKTFFKKEIGVIDENTIEGQFIKTEFERSNKSHRIPLTTGAMSTSELAMEAAE